MKRSGPGLPIIGNPVACPGTLDPDEVTHLRRLDCRAYDRCLDVADAQDWPSFHCNQCRGYQAPTPDEERRTYLGALTFLAKTQLLASLALDDDVFVDETDEDECAGRGFAPGPALTSYEDEAEDDDSIDVAPNGRGDDSSN